MKILVNIKRRIDRYKKLIAHYADEDTIFIYQMGKVGSTSLEHAIDNSIHVHSFYNRNNICPARLKGLAKFGGRHVFLRIEQELIACLLRKVFRNRKNTKIITLVREPISRNISMFFHDIDAYLFSAFTNCLNSGRPPIATRNNNEELLARVFKREFNHDYVLNWFDQEFALMTGINIYDFPFDKQKGSCLIKQGGIKVLCLRSDKIKQCVDELSDFCGGQITVGVVNRSEDNWYHNVYRQFKNDFSYSAEIKDKMINSQFYQHFFKKDEL